MGERVPHIPLRRRRRSICPISVDACKVGCANSRTFSEPEVEGYPPPKRVRRSGIEAVSHSGISSWGRRDAIRSTIYSGSPHVANATMKKTSEGRHHSSSRRLTMGSPPGLARTSHQGGGFERFEAPGWVAGRDGCTSCRRWRTRSHLEAAVGRFLDSATPVGADRWRGISRIVHKSGSGASCRDQQRIRIGRK
jgi:hypothetical protein